MNEQLSNISDEDFFGSHDPDTNKVGVSNLPSQTADKHKAIYFEAVSATQDLCIQLKKTGEGTGDRLKNAIEQVVVALREDERMLMGLANAPYSYISRNIETDGELFAAIVVHGVNVMMYSLKISLDMGVPDLRLPYIGMASVCYRFGALSLPEKTLLAAVNEAGAVMEMDALTAQSDSYLEKISVADFHVDSARYLMTLARENGEVLWQTSLREAMYQYSIVIHMAHEFEKLTHQPAYGRALAPVDAMRKIRDEMSSYFNPDIIKLFFNHLSIYPLGSFVKLSSGETAKVVTVNNHSIIRPTVVIVLDEEGREKLTPVRIDLKMKPNIYIKRAVMDPFLTERYIDLF